MIGTGLTEEQVLNSFIDFETLNPETTLSTEPEIIPKRGLFINVLDIWTSDDEDIQERVDV